MADLLTAVGASGSSGDTVNNTVGPATNPWLLPVTMPKATGPNQSPIMSPALALADPTAQTGSPIQSVGQGGSLSPDQVGSNDDPDKHYADAKQAWLKGQMSLEKAKEAARQVAAVQQPTPPSQSMPAGKALASGLAGALIGAAAGGGRFNRYIGNDVVNAAHQAYLDNANHDYYQQLIASEREKAINQAEQNSALQQAQAYMNQGKTLADIQSKENIQGMKGLTAEDVANIKALASTQNAGARLQGTGITADARVKAAQLMAGGRTDDQLIKSASDPNSPTRDTDLKILQTLHPEMNITQEMVDKAAELSTKQKLDVSHANWFDQKALSEPAKRDQLRAQTGWYQERTEDGRATRASRIAAMNTLAQARMMNAATGQQRANTYDKAVTGGLLNKDEALNMKGALNDLHNRNVYLHSLMTVPDADPGFQAEMANRGVTDPNVMRQSIANELSANVQDGTSMNKVMYNHFLTKAQNAISKGADQKAVAAQFLKDTGQPFVGR